MFLPVPTWACYRRDDDGMRSLTDNDLNGFKWQQANPFRRRQRLWRDTREIGLNQMKAEKAIDIFGWCALHAIGNSDDLKVTRSKHNLRESP
jgi:hypothetical protein